MKNLNIVVFGASRGTGRELVAQAREQGHKVTAFARTPDPTHVSDPGIRMVRGDLMNADTVAQAIEGQEVIFSTVGIAPGDARKPTTLFSEGMKHLVDGARRAGIRRIVCLGSCGTDSGTRPFLPVRLMAPLLKPLFRGVYEDIVRMEYELAGVDLDWTVVRPPYLTNGKFTGRYRIGVGEHLAGVARISRPDLAHCMLQIVSRPTTYRTWIEVSQ